MSLNPKQIYNQANVFLLGAERCFEMRPNGSNSFEAPMVAGVVNTAFALELYLKSLLCQHNCLKKQHNLDDLFLALPETIQDEIAIKLGIDSVNLRTKICDLANAFTEWRYVYEHDGISINSGDLQKISHILKNTAQKYIDI